MPKAHSARARAQRETPSGSPVPSRHAMSAQGPRPPPSSGVPAELLPPLLAEAGTVDPGIFASAGNSSFMYIPRPPGSGLPSAEQLLGRSRLKRLQAVETPYIAPQPPYMHHEEMKRRNLILEQDVKALKKALKQERRERQAQEHEEQQRQQEERENRSRTREAWEADVRRVREECDRLVQAARDDKDVDGGLMGELRSLQEQQRQREAQEKEERVELYRRQVMRRIMNRDLALGYTAWIEMWEAKKYALSRLREVGNRLRAPELSIAFCEWADQWTEAEQLRRFDEAQKKELDLLGNKKVAEAELARVRAEYERKLITAAMEQTAALQRQRIELVGTAEERAGVLEAQAREERIELVRRQMVRRIMNRDIALGFGAWKDLWEATVYAMGRLRDVGNRLRAPELANAFAEWCDDWGETQKLSILEQQQAATMQLAAERDQLLKELQQARLDAETQLAAAERERTAALERLRVQLSGTVDEQQRLREEEEKAAKEERVDLVRRQMVRRIMNRDIALGFGAWQELWQAKAYAMARLREVGNKLRAPEKSCAFELWAADWDAERLAAAAAEAARQSMTIGEFRSRCEQLEVELKAVRQDLCGVLEEKRTLIETLGSLKGDVSSSADALKRQEEIAAAREREERVDLLRRQMVRRIMNRDVALGFGAWAELWQSRVYALTRLREVGNRLRSPEKSFAFGEWAYQWEEAEHTRLLEEQMQRESELLSTKALVEDELAGIRKECEVKLAAKDVELRVALERQKIELVGTAEEREKLHEQQAKEERIDLLRRQMVRRIMNRDIAMCFQTWLGMWEAKVHALSRLRQCANALHTPGLYRGFEQWFTHSEEVRELKLRMAEKRNQARLEYELSQVIASSGLSSSPHALSLPYVHTSRRARTRAES